MKADQVIQLTPEQDFYGGFTFLNVLVKRRMGGSVQLLVFRKPT